jgi:protein TonB
MKAALEFPGFVAVAAALHLGLWAGLPAGGGQSAGAGGEALVSLKAAPGALQALADAWRRPPEAQETVPRPLPETPRQTAAPTLPGTAAPLPRPAAPQAMPGPPSRADTPPAPVPSPAPKFANTAPQIAAPPAAIPTRSAPARPDAAPAPSALPSALPVPVTDAAPSRPAPAPPQPAAPSARPKARPAFPAAPTPETRRQQAAPPVPAQKAAGSGGRQVAGERGTDEATTGSPALRRSLMTQWQGAIGAAIERRKRYPRGTRARGRTVLTLTITRQGQLAAVAVTRSSGQPLLDAAAVSAVRRARLPAAPKGLSEPRYSFRLPVSFAP